MIYAIFRKTKTLRSKLSFFVDRSSLPGQIHMSKSTAKCLKRIGMENFVDRRMDGRHIVATYWLRLKIDEDVQPPDDTEAIFGFV